MALFAVFAVTGLAVFSNISFLHQTYSSYLVTSQIERTDLAAVEIARDTVDPALRLDPATAHTGAVAIEAGPYLAAVDAFGSPAYGESELAAAAPAARAAADSVLAAALRLTSDAVATPATATHCQDVASAGPAQPSVIVLPPGGVSVQNPGQPAVSLALGRFGDGFEINARTVARGASRNLSIPPDRSARPWQLKLSGEGPVVVCALDAAGGGG